MKNFLFILFSSLILSSAAFAKNYSKEETHFLQSINTEEGTITLDDGSIWRFHPKSHRITDTFDKLANWKSGDMIVFENPDSFSPLLQGRDVVNLTVKENWTVFYRLLVVLEDEGTTSLEIKDITDNQLILNDGSTWKMHCVFSDGTKGNWEWMVGDKIMIAASKHKKTHFFEADKPYVLFNTTIGSWGKAEKS